MKTLFLCYNACSTCRNAKKWLDDNKIDYTQRAIVDENPTVEELIKWISMSGLPVKKFFNTSGLVYKEQNIKDKLPGMSEQQQIELLATNGKLIKRPLLITGKSVLVGFRPEDWEKELKL